MFDSTGDPDGSGELNSTSYFGELYYRVTDTLKITAGLRYNDDERKTSSTSVLYNAINADAVGSGLPGFLVGLGLLHPDYLTNGTPGAGGTNWTRTLNLLLGPFGTPAGRAAEATIASLYGVTEAQIAAANLTAAYSPERFAISQMVPIVPQFNEVRTLTGSPAKVDFQETTGRLGIDWQWRDNSMLFAFFTRGYKPGGFNPPIPPEFQSTSSFAFAPEKVDSFEIGSKNLLLDNTLVLNASVFFYDYGGLQVSRIVNNSSLNDNIDAEVYGAELEGLWRPAQVPRLTVDFSYAHLKAEASGGATSVDPLDRTGGDPAFTTLKNIDAGAFTAQSFVARRSQITQAHIDEAYSACRALSHLNANALCPSIAPGTTYSDGLPAYFSKQYLDGVARYPSNHPTLANQLINTVGIVETNTGFERSIDGNSLPSSPEHQFKLGLAYDFELPIGTLTPRIDYYWQGKMYGREFNTKGDVIDAWDQVNASLALMAGDGRWQANLWVRNLMNEDNITGHYLTSDTSGFFRNYFLTEPRIWGASVRWNFGAN
jgi:iron complex outermembrane recepter protein